MYRVLLFKEGTHISEIPSWWLNFMERNGGRGAFQTLVSSNEVLKKWNVTLCPTKPAYEGYGDRYLDFESEEDATMFFLKESIV